MKHLRKFNESNDLEPLDFEERFIDAIDMGFDYRVKTSKSGEQIIEFPLNVIIFKESKVLEVGELILKSKQLEKLSKLVSSITFNCETIELLGYVIKITTDTNCIRIQEVKSNELCKLTNGDVITFSKILLSQFICNNLSTTIVDIDDDVDYIDICCDYIDTYEHDNKSISEMFKSELTGEIFDKILFKLSIGDDNLGCVSIKTKNDKYKLVLV